MLKKVLLLLVLCFALYGCDDGYNNLKFEKDFGDTYVDKTTHDKLGNMSGYYYRLYDICINGESINSIITDKYGYIRYGYQVHDERIKITWKIVKYTYKGLSNYTYTPEVLSSHSKSVYINSDSTIYLGIGTLREGKE